MAMTPGGRAPSAPPLPPRLPREPRPGGGRPPAANQAAGASVLRWGLLVGGLVIIADLATKAAKQRGAGADFDGINVLDTVDTVLNAALFTIGGAAVVRETGRVPLAALAGLLAGLLDGLVVGAAESIAPTPGELAEQALLVSLVYNALQGTGLAAASAWISRLGQRRRGG